MSIKLIEDKTIWDTFVDNSPYSILPHKWDYLEITAKSTGYNVEYYGIYDGTELIALFPIFSRNLLGFKSLFSPPPQTEIPYLGFIMGPDFNSLRQSKKEKRASLVIDSFANMVNERGFNYISITTVPNFLDVRSFKWNSYDLDVTFNYSIDLSQSSDDIFNGFSKETKRLLNKANSFNLSLERSNDLSIFYEMEVKRYAEKGLNFPLVNQKYLEELFRRYPENLFLYYLYDNDKKIIGSITTQEYKDQFSLWMGNTRIVGNICGNEVIYWELIKKAKEKKFKCFDIGGASVRNISIFKSKFNPSLDITYSIKKQDSLGKLAETVYRQFIKKKII